MSMEFKEYLRGVRETVWMLLNVIKVMRKVGVVFIVSDTMRVVFSIITSHINPNAIITYVTLLLILLLAEIIKDEYVGVIVKKEEVIVNHYGLS